MRESFLDNSEFMELVRICITTRCTYAQAVRIIRKAGFQISAKTFQRAKTEIAETKKKRISQIADEFPEYAANTIDTATAVDFELWSIINTTKNVWEKLKAIDMVMRNCKDKSTHFGDSPALSKVAKKIEEGKTAAESKMTKPAKAVTDEVKSQDIEKHDMEKDQGPDPN